MSENFQIEMINIGELKPHPKNYQQHPDEQLQHVVKSIENYGVYKNVVISSDNFILAGHGVVQAAKSLNIKSIPVKRLKFDHDDTNAIKLMIGDNEIEHLADKDDRLLTELLGEIKNVNDLIGTGYDEMMLANLVFVTRPQSEIEDFNSAAHWVDMPEYENQETVYKVIVSFRSIEDKNEFLSMINADELVLSNKKKTTSTWWPRRDKFDLKSVRFEADDSDE